MIKKKNEKIKNLLKYFIFNSHKNGIILLDV